MFHCSLYRTRIQAWPRINTIRQKTLNYGHWQIYGMHETVTQAFKNDNNLQLQGESRTQAVYVWGAICVKINTNCMYIINEYTVERP